MTFIMASPAYSLIDGPSLSFLSRHLSIFYSQSGHNANPNALKSFPTYTLLITLLLCQLQGSLLLCISLLPLSLTTETTI